MRAILVALAALAMSFTAFAQTAKPMTTIVIAARADLPDPNFRDSVVLVMNNLGPAPAGLIVNRPTKIGVAELFPDIAGLARTDARVYFGGPVHIGTVSFIFRADRPPEGATPVLERVYLSNDRDLLRKLLSREKPMEGLRIFAGYAGWGPGQLENEIARGDWTLVPADSDAIFGGKSEHPWPGTGEAGSGRRI